MLTAVLGARCRSAPAVTARAHPTIQEPDTVLAAHARGLAARAGHTEAAVALARLAGRFAVAVCCEITADDGAMARLPEFELFAPQHGLPMLAIADLTAHVQRRPSESAILDSAVDG